MGAGLKRLQIGLTFVETVITLAIAALSLAIALPSYQSVVHINRLSAGSNAVSGSLQLARSEAVLRGQRVTMCVSDDGNTCSPMGGWHRGWIVFHDPDANAQHAEDETLIRVQQALDSLSITGNQPVARYVSYSPLGWPRQISGALQMGTLTVCVQHEPGRKVVLSRTGRVRLDSADC